jgi:hypothetical protein
MEIRRNLRQDDKEILKLKVVKIMNNDKKESKELLIQARTCKVDLTALIEKINQKLEKDKDNKTALEAKRVVKDRLAVKEAVTGIPQQYK